MSGYVLGNADDWDKLSQSFYVCPLCGSKHLASREEERKGHFDPIVNLLWLNEFGQADRIESW